MMKSWVFSSLRSWTREGFMLLPLLFNIIGSRHGGRKKPQRYTNCPKEEVKLSLLTDGRIVSVQNPVK